MTGTGLITADPDIFLVPIDIERDAAYGVAWLKGNTGRDTLRKMGVTDEDNHESTLAHERERLQEILDDPQEIAWMIRVNERIVGIVEVHMKRFEQVPGPNISIMIGDTTYRDRGIGSLSIQTVKAYLLQFPQIDKLYARHLTDNTASAALLRSAGFVEVGKIYKDDDGLEWQNMVYER